MFRKLPYPVVDAFAMISQKAFPFKLDNDRDLDNYLDNKNN